MKSTTNWLEHLRAASEQGRDLTVYGKSWAHDVRCMHIGVTHRRVGASTTGHDEWLQAGMVARMALPKV